MRLLYFYEEEGLELSDWRRLYNLLSIYVNDVNSEVIVLKNVYEGGFKLLHYRHMFPHSKLKRRLNDFNLIFDKAYS